MKVIPQNIVKGNKIFLLIYYFILLLILISWNDIDNLPPMMYRIVYSVLVLIPLLSTRSIIFPAILIFYITISAERHAVSFMLYKQMYVAIIAIANYFFFANHKANNNAPSVLWFLLIICTLSDIINDFSIHAITFTIISVILFWHYIVYDGTSLKMWTWVFIAIAFILSLDFLYNGANFATQILVSGSNYERLGWNDPNYLCSILCIGGLPTYFEMMDSKSKVFSRMIAALIFISISFVMIRMASRGAILALGIGILVYTLFSNNKIITKAAISVFTILFIYYIQKKGYFDLLEARIIADDGTGSGRMTIWQNKLEVFLNSGNLFHWFFGYGYQGGIELGARAGFHNDFVAFLVEYGIVGLITLLSFFLYLLKDATNKIKAFSLTLALITICISLEPLSSARLTFWFFIMYIYYVGHNIDNRQNNLSK